ncbi:MAG: right-handed parallel beta-helix repeat-containing protein [Bacteroidota bacterium]
MIVKGKHSSGNTLRMSLLLLLSLAGIYAFWYYLPFLTSWKKAGMIHCDAEVVRGKNFISNGDQFFNAHTQSSEVAFRGAFSSKVNAGEGYQFGFGLDFEDFTPGKTYVASVWRKKEFHGGVGALVIIDNNGVFNLEIKAPVKEKNDWELLSHKFTIPFEKKIDNLRIYVRTDGKGIFYFDDLKIVEQEETKETSQFMPQTIQLSLSPKALKKLDDKRKQALQVGILQTEADDWVKGMLTAPSSAEEMPIELRLKGDWLDHLKNDKWSYRIQVKDPYAWNRLKTFSLQSPETREFLQEWILHQWWKKEDVLTPRYDFVELKINGTSKGIYAYEEHFEKQLPESNERREGVIVRFSEEGFWEDVKMRLSDLEGNPLAHINNSAHYKTSEIRPFKEKQIAENPALLAQLEVAQGLLKNFIDQDRPVHEIFDTERVAAYFAICDLMHAQHSVAWHNMRFYFNPILNKLEPIGFDGFPTYNYPFLLLSEGALSQHFKEDDEPISYFFRDTTFLKQYIYKLFYFSSDEYWSSFINEFESGILARADFITKEFQNYQPNLELIEKRVKGIRSGITPIDDFSVRAFFDKNNSKIFVGNTHSLPVEIIGSGRSAKQVDAYLKKKVLLPAYVTQPFYINQSKKKKKKAPDLAHIIRHEVEHQEVDISPNVKYLFYRVLGSERVFFTKIRNWSLPKTNKINPTTETPTLLTSNALYKVTGNKVIFRSGKRTTNQDVIIPAGYKVYFSAGTEIDFTQGAKFLSYAPLLMEGTKENPIKIFSSDGTNNGFTILQAEETSKLKYVLFENLNTHRKANWNLTGAVTFYESEVIIEDAYFSKSQSEDALNIVRSDFEIRRCVFSSTFSDGLDLDFSNGSVSDSKFLNTNNDGLDVSGSNVYVVNGEINTCGDKGISVGEASKVIITSANIINCPVGVASKDMSEVIIEDINISECKVGFAVYQKKPEFGNGKMEVKKYASKKVETLYNVAKGSYLDMNGKIINP